MAGEQTACRFAVAYGGAVVTWSLSHTQGSLWCPASLQVHTRSVDHKLLAIHQLDELVTKPVVTWLRENKVDFRLLVLSDHKTLMRTRGHDGDPVPFFLYDSTAERPCGLAYTEENGKAGPYLPAGLGGHR